MAARFLFTPAADRSILAQRGGFNDRFWGANMRWKAPDAAKPAAAAQANPVVFVVDDDVSVRESLELLIQSAGWLAETFESAQDFLARPRLLAPSCLILDVAMPGLNGLDLQKRVAVDRPDMPIIFLTGYGDVPMTVQAMKAGAVEFLTKPFSDDVLLGAVEKALQRSRAALDHENPAECVAGALCVAEPARTRGHGAGRDRVAEQAGRRRTRHQRDHGQGAPRQHDAEDASRFAAGPGEHVRASWPPARSRGRSVGAGGPRCEPNCRAIADRYEGLVSLRAGAGYRVIRRGSSG